MLVLFAGFALAQSVLTGTVVDGDKFPVSGAEVMVEGTDNVSTTNDNGMFSISVEAGEGVLQISDALIGSQEISYVVAEGETKDLGNVSLAGDEVSLNDIVVVGKGVIDLEEDRKTPVAVSTVLREEIQEKAQGNVEFPEVIKNTPNIYVSNQAGGFGDSKMFVRGYDQTNTAFLLNGQPINGMEDGKMYWSNWSGMTDVANAVQVQRGLGSSKLAISSVGGTINIVTKATEKKKGGYVQGIVGNDSYMKGAIGYNTGLSENGWGLSVAVSHWQAHRKWAEGTRGQGQSYFLSVGKQMGNHNVNFLLTGAPQWHDQNFSKSETAYEQYGKKYNNNIGFYNNGDYLSMRRNYYHKPVMNLNWDWTINDKMSLSTVAYASFGRGGGTGGYGTGYRTNDSGYYDWSAIEEYNSTVVGQDQVAGGQNLPTGFTGNNIGYYYFNNGSRQREGLLLRASVNNHSWFGGVTNFNYEVNENLSFNVGADVRFYQGDHFRQVVDFLGLEGYYDNVGPAQRQIVTSSYDANPWSALFDFAGEDERINYDNSENINYQGGFGQVEYKNDVFSVFFQGAVSNQSYKKEDRYNFEGSRVGEKVSKMGYNLKGGAAFFINENNSVFANAGFYSRQPFLDNIYTGNYDDATELINPEIDNEEITGIEAGYKFSKRNLGININLYHTTWDNRSISNFSTNDNGTPDNLSDDYREQELARAVKQVHKGAEIDFYAKPFTNLKLTGYFTYGDWTYDGTGSVQIINNDTGVILDTYDGVDNQGVHISNAPQTSMGLGLDYNITKGLSLDSNFNWYGRNYKYVSFSDIEDEGKTVDYTTLDAGITYEVKFGNKKLKLRGNVYNVFNNLPITQTSKYGVYFANGRTWNAGVTYNF